MTECISLTMGRQITTGKLGVRGSRASGVNYADSSATWHEALQLCTTGLYTCQANWMLASTWQVLST